MGKTSNNKYQPYSLEKCKIMKKKFFSEKGQSFHAECLRKSLKHETSRIKETLFQNNLSKISTKKAPIFFGKRIFHKMIDDSEPVWYEGIVTKLL